VGKLRLVALIAAAAVASGAPAVLVDGSKPPPLPAPFRSVRQPPFVLTRAAVVPASRVPRECRRYLGRGRVVKIVERVGIDARTWTVRIDGPAAGNDSVSGCGLARGPGGHLAACSAGTGDLRGSAVIDARLGVCPAGGHRQIGVGYINPLAAARWIAVEETGYVELFPVVGGVPVQLTTRNSHGSEATFRITQYSGDGYPLLEATVRTAVAG
jgi:hypothetical protein